MQSINDTWNNNSYESVDFEGNHNLIQHWQWLLNPYTGVTYCALDCIGQLSSFDLEKEPSCFVFTSFSWSSCRWPRLKRYSMCMTSVFLRREFSRNSSRILGMNPGLSWPARRNCRYSASTCFCSLLWRTIFWETELWGGYNRSVGSANQVLGSGRLSVTGHVLL